MDVSLFYLCMVMNGASDLLIMAIMSNIISRNGGNDFYFSSLNKMISIVMMITMMIMMMLMIMII